MGSINTDYNYVNPYAVSSTPTEGTDATTGATGVTSDPVTVSNAEGGSSTGCPALPDIESNGTTGDCNANLNATADKLAETGVTYEGRHVMFDVYSVLDLIMDTSQNLRNALRAARMAEMAGIQANILAQAETQRQAATVALAVGIGTAVLSGVMMGVSFKSLGSSATQNSGRQKAAGLDAMRKQLRMAVDGGDQTKVNKNFSQMSKEIESNPALKKEIDEEFEKAGFKIDEQGEIQLTNADEASTVKDLKAKVVDAKNDLDKAQKADNQVDGENVDGNNINNEIDNDVDQAPQGKEKANPELDTAKEKYDKAVAEQQTKADELYGRLSDVVGKFQQKFDDSSVKALSLRDKKNDGNLPKEMKNKASQDYTQAKGELEKAAVGVNYARAFQLKAAWQIGSPSKSVSRAWESASGAVDLIMNRTASGTLGQQAHFQKAIQLGQTMQIVSQLGAAIGQGASGAISAEATELQGGQKYLEEELDQVKDLFANEQQSIQQAIQVFSSVTQKESQSVEDIIHGIKA